MSPVDYALVPNADGSASIWVGNVDAVFGSSWRVELRLRPGRAVLEQHTTLFNGGDARHRYYWWTNAAVEVGDDSELVYPTHLMATHGFTAIEPWPIDAQRQGSAESSATRPDGPVSLFTYKTREPFIGVWHPATRTGTMRAGLAGRAADAARSGRGASTATRTPGARRCLTIAAPTSSCSRGSSATRRPTRFSARRSASHSRNTGCRFATWMASRARPRTPSSTRAARETSSRSS